jgi:hypothetical protein
MKQYPVPAIIILITFMGFTACADFNSINRKTELPFSGDSEGVAIHLDAKQRIVFAKQFGAICAEPSPDALSAFANALGAGVSVPQEAAGSVSLALQESASSIGLRTQSIQLLRDALYRTCEAYYGRAINSAQLMELHTRFQDVMVGILAIEQLTGATVAKQVGLSGLSNATASSQLVQMDGLLENAKANETEKGEKLKKAIEERDTLQSSVESKQKELDEARSKTPQDIQNVESLENEMSELQQKLKLAEANVESAKEIGDQAKETRETVEKNRGAALTAAHAAASGTAEFSTPASVINLSDQSTQAIATAVGKIVDVIVNKERIMEKCLSILEKNNSQSNSVIVDTCQKVVLGSHAESSKGADKQAVSND